MFCGSTAQSSSLSNTMSLYERCSASKSKYLPTPERPVKSRPINGSWDCRWALPYSWATGGGEVVKCVRMMEGDAPAAKAEVSELIGARSAGRGSGITLLV
jgi:hypothetical protein